MSAQGGVRPGGVNPPPVNRITDTCENITFPQLLVMITVHNSSCRKVMFSQVCVKNSVHGGNEWWGGA